MLWNLCWVRLKKALMLVKVTNGQINYRQCCLKACGGLHSPVCTGHLTLKLFIGCNIL